MGILCDFFIADGATIPNYDVGQEFDDADKCEFKGLTSLECAQLLIPVITELAALARRAIETKKSMFLWNSL